MTIGKVISSRRVVEVCLTRYWYICSPFSVLLREATLNQFYNNSIIIDFSSVCGMVFRHRHDLLDISIVEIYSSEIMKLLIKLRFFSLRHRWPWSMFYLSWCRNMRVLHIYSNVTRKSVIIVFGKNNIWPYNHCCFIRFI